VDALRHIFFRLHLIRGRLARDHGQTMAEYAILIAWIVLLVVVAATQLGSTLSHALSSTASRV
jgi:Flp pilus assembly pilin Flp